MSRFERDERRVTKAQIDVLRGFARQVEVLTEMVRSFGDEARWERARDAFRETDQEIRKRIRKLERVDRDVAQRRARTSGIWCVLRSGDDA